jgi:hypothetical protein
MFVGAIFIFRRFKVGSRVRLSIVRRTSKRQNGIFPTDAFRSGKRTSFDPPEGHRNVKNFLSKH